MFCLTRTIHHDGVSLTIEGELNSESVETLESACNKALTQHSKVTVILNDIIEFDADGIAFIKRIAQKTQVRAVGIFSRHVRERILGRETPRLH